MQLFLFFPMKESTVYNTQACPICRNNITVNRLKGHVEVCQRNMKPCKFCGTFIKREDEKRHLSICKKVTYGKLFIPFLLNSIFLM